jgi:lauroyl/myristoyl acyltransferase
MPVSQVNPSPSVRYSRIGCKVDPLLLRLREHPFRVELTSGIPARPRATLSTSRHDQMIMTIVDGCESEHPDHWLMWLHRRWRRSNRS